MIRTKVSLSPEKFSSLLVPMLAENRDVVVPVTGNSMYPLWKHRRDSVVLSSCDKFGLKKGDITLYRRPSGQIVLHRIVKVNKDSYDMCGDAQTRIEPKVPKENMLAVVISFTRNGKEFQSDHIVYKTYKHIWLLTLPLRRMMAKSFRILRSFIR